MKEANGRGGEAECFYGNSEPPKGQEEGTMQDGKGGMSTPVLEEEEKVISFQFDDEWLGMTYGRRIAHFLSRYKWYNPRGLLSRPRLGPASETSPLVGGGNGRTSSRRVPILDEAWSFFEHVTLPRRFVDDDGKEIHSAVDSIKAAPGEMHRETKLYNPLATSLSELADFGIGIGLYFSALRMWTVILFITGLIHVLSFRFFSSPEYSSDAQIELPWQLRGSAICTQTEWVPCPTCQRPSQQNTLLKELWESNRLISVEPANGEGDPLIFALRNSCDDGDDLKLVGYVSWAATIFLVVSMAVYGTVQRRLEVKFDERNATATDFAVSVDNPPDDANNPDEWKEYLETAVKTHLEKTGNPAAQDPRNSHVTVLTIALENNELTDVLVKRRKVKGAAEALILETDMKGCDDYYDELVQILASSGQNEKEAKLQWKHSKKLFDNLSTLYTLQNTIKELEGKKYDAMRVFAIFETEIGQRALLSALDAPKLRFLWNSPSAVSDSRYLFRGERVIHVHEPMEPMTVRWRDLGIPSKEMLTRFMTSVLISAGMIYLCFRLVRGIWQVYGPSESALAIAILNMVVPQVCRFITDVEVHTMEGYKQASHNAKVTAFRWINSAIAIHIINPFAMSITAGNHLIASVYAIFVAEMMTAPTMQVLNIPANLKRHVFGPRAKTQEQMNNMFTGARWELAERYTNLKKILFMTFFFSALFPGSFLLASLALFIHYQVDKFCLMRVWARAPMVGREVSQLNRSVVSPVLMVTLAVMNAYLWTGFPYDNLCVDEEFKTPEAYAGNHIFTVPEFGSFNITIDSDEMTSYHTCSQDFMGRIPPRYPPLPQFQDETSGDFWMSPGQEEIARLHAWTSVVVSVVAILYILLVSDVSDRIRSLFFAIYSPSGRIYGTDFSDVPGDTFPAYVPQLKVKGMSRPLIAADISGINLRYVGWADLDSPDYSEYNLTKDVSPEAAKNSKKPIFSVVKEWVPPVRKEKGSE